VWHRLSGRRSELCPRPFGLTVVTCAWRPVHLKSLTLRGFKSFASATTLRFEPGVTAVVGPNGSGKSNVVDAVAWVLGEQGAKALRGGKMEDVIFAGTAGRAPLGRAEVTLTIDNSDGKLPIEFAEVSITRRMFRDGASEYEINGEGVRLLDVQELLSDSGIGRELHVIVGQGQLDSVLSARPEDRRGFIEEAAGVLKHRKRKERAVRKLEAMSLNLTRLNDLTAELRRQLKPLGKQAEIARRAAGVQAELRDSRLRLLAADLVSLTGALEVEVADENAIRAQRTAVEATLTQARSREAELEQIMAADAPLLASAQETWYRLSALEERYRGTSSLAVERARHLSAESTEVRLARDPDALESEALEVRQQESELGKALEESRVVLHEAVAFRQELERGLVEADRALVTAARAFADRREGLAKLAGQVNVLRTRSSAAADEIARLTSAVGDARERAAVAENDLAALSQQVGALDEGELSLDQRHEAAVAAQEEVELSVRQLTAAEREAERERSTWTARGEALAMGLTRKDGAGSVLAAGARLPGVLGSVAALLTVEAGHEAALAAALGAIADAVAVASAEDASAALELLKAQDAGRVGLLIGGHDTARGDLVPTTDISGWPALPPGAVWARELVRGPDALTLVIEAALDRVAVVDDLAAATSLTTENPTVRAVTRAGDILGARWAAGGSASSPSAIEIQAAVDEAQNNASEAGARLEHLRVELNDATTLLAERNRDVEQALIALHESDAKLSAVSEHVAQLGQAARAAVAEADRLDRARQAAQENRDRDLGGLAEMEERLRLAEAESDEPTDPDTTQRDALQVEVSSARQAELDARLTVRTGEERVRAMAGRADSLMKAAHAEREARREEQHQRAARARGAVIATAVGEICAVILVRIARSVEQAGELRDAAHRARVVREGELLALRTTIREQDEQLARLTDAVHRDEITRAEQRLRIEALQTRAVAEHGIEVEVLMAEYGPELPSPPSALEMAEYEQALERGEQVIAPIPGRVERSEHDKRVARAERELALLGKVNPLALEEFAALEERHQFLSVQLEDLKATRRDLLQVVREVDERILEVFTSAYHDVAREFELVFATLFPGGEGRLVLTDPDDMLMTGIEVEARPPGKKVKRLSLLSGGERSLTAVALLVAIFRARPSPFYLLDEVEAALDDTNLGRLIELVEQLRTTSQLIVITHQKRTMEIADALYGVTMRGDGISQVVSQRLREPEAVSA
jgi:chromosome segregation protein